MFFNKLSDEEILGGKFDNWEADEAMKENTHKAYRKAKADAQKAWDDGYENYKKEFLRLYPQEKWDDNRRKTSEEMFVNGMVLRQVKRSIVETSLEKMDTSTQDVTLLKDILGIGWFDIADSTKENLQFWALQAMIMAASMAAG